MKPDWMPIKACFLSLSMATALVLGCVDKPAEQPPDETTDPAQPVAAEEIYFGPRFVQGDVTLFRFKADNSSIQTQGETTMNDSTYTEYIMRVTTDAVAEDGSADFTVTYDVFYTAGDIYFGGKYEYNSETGASEGTDARIAAIWDDLKDCTIHFHADGNGTVDPATVTGTQRVVEAMSKLTATQGRAGEFNADGLAKLYESMWRIGNESITKKAGESWTDVEKTPVEGLGTWIFTSDYKMLSVTPQAVNLGMRMNMALEFNPPEQAPEGQLPILESKFNTIKGDFHYNWDRKRQILKERSGELEFTWLMVQEGIFEGDVVRTEQNQHVISSLTRLDN